MPPCICGLLFTHQHTAKNDKTHLVVVKEKEKEKETLFVRTLVPMDP